MILSLIFGPEVFVVFGATFILVVDTIVVLSHLEQLQQSLIYVVSSLQLVDSLSRGGRRGRGEPCGKVQGRQISSFFRPDRGGLITVLQTISLHFQTELRLRDDVIPSTTQQLPFISPFVCIKSKGRTSIPIANMRRKSLIDEVGLLKLA